MHFRDQIKQRSERLAQTKDKILNEATTNTFPIPFINPNNYDVFNPLEAPKPTADSNIKKGEKLDYAIAQEGNGTTKVERKHWSADPDTHNSRVFRYFHTTTASFETLTIGIVYRFYTDLVEANKMDDKPFFGFRIDDMKDVQVEKLKEFHKSYCNPDSIINTASGLKFMLGLRNEDVKEITEPADEFTWHYSKVIYPSILKPKLLDQFKCLLKKSFQKYINDAINERIKSVLATDQHKAGEMKKEDLSSSAADGSKIQTTAEEMEGFYIVRAIVCAKVKVTRVANCDQQTYFAILLDDNNRKLICRLYYNGKKKYVSFFDTGKRIKWKLKIQASCMNLLRG